MHIKLFLIFSISVARAQLWFAATDLVNRLQSNVSLNPSEPFVNYRPNIQLEQEPFLPISITKNVLNGSEKPQLVDTNRDLKFGKVDSLAMLLQKQNQTLATNSSFHQTITPFNTKQRTYTGMRRRKCPTLRRKQKGYRSPKDKSRFLEVFHVVNIENVACSSSSGLEGACLHQYECGMSGGVAMGNCADGFGVCCVKQFSCGDTTAATEAWFTSPGFPAPGAERLSCALTVDKASGGVLQIRLDLMSFELLPPTEGSCEQDQFVVSGHNVNSLVPTLCGVNNGQHLYVEVGDVPGPIYLSVQTVTADSRLFAIKVSQLTAGDARAAPTGCLQLHAASQGVLESFNYQDKSALVVAKNPSYLNNMNYAMCIQRAPETCSVTYTNAEHFQIPNFDAYGLPVIPADQAGVEIFNCPSDWLLAAAARLCGERLNDGSVLQDFAMDAPITDSSTGPIVVWFRSDGAAVGRGFRLQYTQNACTPRSKRQTRQIQEVNSSLRRNEGRTFAWSLFFTVWLAVSAYMKFLVISTLGTFR